MKWYIRNRPEWGPFDTRGEAVAWAWSKTVPGMKRPKVDGVWDSDTDHIETDMRLTMQAFDQLGEAAEDTARKVRQMMARIDSILPDTIEGKATELKHDNYHITFTAKRNFDTVSP